MKKVILYIKLLVLCLANFSCGNFLNEYSQTAAYIETVDDLDELLIAEGYLGREYGDESEFTLLHILADESQEAVTQPYGGGGAAAGGGNLPWKTMRGLYVWAEDPFVAYDGSTRSDVVWANCYARISGVNTILDDGQAFVGNEKTDAQLNRIFGECYFLRAWNYFMLANIYGLPYNKDNLNDGGSIPLKLNPEIEDTKFSRDNTGDVYDQIVADLKNSVSYLNRGEKASSNLHASVAAAWALLSRVYLYMEEYELCEQAADSVEGYGLYNFGSYSIGSGNTFLTTNCSEVIFAQGISGIESVHESTTRGSGPNVVSEGKSFCVGDELENLFFTRDDSDNRISNDLRASVFFTVSYFVATEQGGKPAHPGFLVCRKYRTVLDYTEYDPLTRNRITSVVNGTELNEVGSIRYAEVVLNKAEAQACRDRVNEARVMMSNFLATRYSEVPDMPTDKADLIEFIRQERYKELCFEGHRWFDLRRYAVNKAHRQTTSIRHEYHVQITQESFPIEGNYVLEAYNDQTKGVWMLPLPDEMIDYCYPIMTSYDRKNGVTRNVY
ncbi:MULTISPECIES: RagB/SusD family nutrient uptake outer membrane protein [Butyricimonas]|uniref:RagB/SusD family nutrient uptake outer membrane protein n=1 Tax=Butyricimonas TaxID=574697 RepID=UPI0007FB25CA|nr:MULTISPECIES: RagB/SusD family nutrient uptake outer membrane protein [Butyricimonas]